MMTNFSEREVPVTCPPMSFNPFQSVAVKSPQPAASSVPDSKSLSEFEKSVLGQPLSQPLQDEIRRTIAVRNMPGVTTDTSLQRCLGQIPGGIKNIVLFHEPPQHRAALVEFNLPSGPNAHDHLARLGDLSPFIMVTVPKVTVTQVNHIRNPPAASPDPFGGGAIANFFAPIINFGAPAASPAQSASVPNVSQAPMLVPIEAPRAAAPYSDLRSRVVELEAEVSRLTKMLAESEDQNQTLLMLLQESSPQLAANFRKASLPSHEPKPAANMIPQVQPAAIASAAVIAVRVPSPLSIPYLALLEPPSSAVSPQVAKVAAKPVPAAARRGGRVLELSAGEAESRRLMLSMKVFDQWRRWAHRKGLARKGDQLTQKLLKEEAAVKQRELEKKKYNCPICFSEITVSELYLVDECNHRFCKDCLQGYLNTKINDGQTMEITCPVPKCATKMSDREIKNLVVPKTYEKFEKFRLEKGLSLMEDVRFCPKAACGIAMVGDPDSPMMVCQACKYSYCFNCKEEWHADSTCEQFQKWKAENKSADSKYREWVQKNAKQCPKCKTIIEKNGGCNHMTCGKCRHQFCWLCMKGYASGHFGNMPWSCKQYS